MSKQQGDRKEQRTLATCLLLLARHALDVELQLLALQHEAVAPPALPRPRRDAREQPARVELRVEVRVEDAPLLTRRDLALDRAALLLLLIIIGALLLALWYSSSCFSFMLSVR